MDGLEIGVDGRVHLSGSLLDLLIDHGIEHRINNLLYQVAVNNMKAECVRAKSDGIRCAYSPNVAVRRCGCAAALAALHDIDPDELTPEKFAMIVGVP